MIEARDFVVTPSPARSSTAHVHPSPPRPPCVVVSRSQGVAGVCYAPHSSSEHFWIGDQDDLNEILGGEGGDGLRPRVYVSRGKHAGYPVSGKGELLDQIRLD